MAKRLKVNCLLLIIIVIGGVMKAQAQNTDSLPVPGLSHSADSLVVPENTVFSAPEKSQAPVDEPVVKPKRRLVAAFLCVALGPFGMHRLYLGTKPHVAAAYTLTLGGGLGLVPLIDFFHIVFDPDLSKYKDNNRFIMWLKP